MKTRKKITVSKSKKILPTIDHSHYMSDFKETKSGEKKPKVHLRYGKLSDIQNKGTLICTIIEEHLLKFGYLDTYDKYINEVAIRNAINKNQKEKFYKISELKEIIFTAAKMGNLKKSLSFWERLIKRVQCDKPNFERNDRLEFRLRVFLAIFHLHPYSGTKIVDEDRIVEVTSRRLTHFNQYLGEKGAKFVEDEEFTEYFSVPYILTSDWDETDRLKHVFEKDWLDSLFENLEYELEHMTHDMEETAGTRTLIEEMADHFIKNMAEMGKESTLNDSIEEYEIIEREAQDVTDEIHNLEEVNDAEKYELNLIANKYEMLKDKYEDYLKDIKSRQRRDMWLKNNDLVLPKEQNPVFLQEASIRRKERKERKKKRKDKGDKEYNFQLNKTVFEPYDLKDHHLRVQKLWKKIYAHLLDRAFNLIDQIEKDETMSHDYKKLSLEILEAEENFSQLEQEFGSDPEAVFQLAQDLGIDEDANIERVYEIKEEEMTEKITKGDAYDSEAILCFLLRILRKNRTYEFEGIEKVVIYAFDKFGEMRDEFLDFNDMTSTKFGDRKFTYDLMTAFLYYMCTREDVRGTFRSNDFIVITFNQFQDFVDAHDEILDDEGILSMMNIIIYRVLHLMKNSYLGIKSKIRDEQLLKNLLNLALNHDTYKIPEEHKEEVLSVLYTLIFMNSPSFGKLLDFHVKSLCESMVKQMVLNRRGRLFRIIGVLLLLRFSPHQYMKKVKGMEDMLKRMKLDYESDKHFVWLYSLVCEKKFRVDKSMMREIDSRMESLGFEMKHSTIMINEETAEERLWYFERKSIVEKTLEYEKLKREEDKRKSETRKKEKKERKDRETENSQSKQKSKKSRSKVSKKSKKKKKKKKKG